MKEKKNPMEVFHVSLESQSSLTISFCSSEFCDRRFPSRTHRSGREADDGDEFCAVSLKPCLSVFATLLATIRMLDYRANRCGVPFPRTLGVSKVDAKKKSL